jgi:hypothetical protein
MKGKHYVHILILLLLFSTWDLSISQQKALAGISDPLNFPDHGVLLDGATSYIVYPQMHLPLSQPLTIEGWFKPQLNEAASTATIALSTPVLSGFGDCWLGTFQIAFSRNGTNPNQFNIIAAVVSGYEQEYMKDWTPHNYDSWHHVALTIDIDAAYLFFDGRPVSEGLLMPDGICDNGQGIYLGGQMRQGEMYVNYKGAASEIRISNIIRYTQEFVPQSSYARDANTLSLWHLWGSVKDDSGNLNDGVIYGNITYIYPPLSPPIPPSF